MSFLVTRLFLRLCDQYLNYTVAFGYNTLDARKAKRLFVQSLSLKWPSHESIQGNSRDFPAKKTKQNWQYIQKKKGRMLRN